MKVRKTLTLLVCLVCLVMATATAANAWNFKPAAFDENEQYLLVPSSAPAQNNPAVAEAPRAKEIYKVKPRPIVKCKPAEGAYRPGTVLDRVGPVCVLPVTPPKGWELSAEALYVRSKGHVRFVRGNYAWTSDYMRDVDLNSDLGLPEHQWLGSFSASYRFNPRWSLRYSILPMVMDSSGTTNSTFAFGNNTHTSGTTVRSKWERLYHRMGIVYDPIRTISSRVSLFGDYVRINDKLSVIQPGCCGDVMDNEFNMAMAGIEFEKCLKTGRFCNTLSIECKAGVAFGDDGVGADMATGLKYSIPMSSGRWGYVKGGYRFMTFKKKSSDVRLVDTAMEGGFVQMGFVF